MEQRQAPEQQAAYARAANPAVRELDAAARIGLVLQALALVIGVALILLGTSGGAAFVLLLGVLGGYLARNPLRHVAAVTAVLSVLCTVAPVVAMFAGVEVWPDSLVIRVAVVGPRIGMGLIAAISAVGIVQGGLRLKR